MNRLAPLRALARPPLRARAIAVVVAAALLGALAWYLGTDTVHSVVLAVGIFVVCLAWLAVPEVGPLDWRDESRTDDDGGRGDVRRLSWSLRPRRGRVRHQALARIRSLAAARLALHDLDLDSAADQKRIEALIGSRSLRTLQANPAQPPLFHDVVRCLDSLSRLAGDEAGVAEPTTLLPTLMSRVPIRRRSS